MTQQNWEDEFDEKFTVEEIGQKVSFLIKCFIINLLSQQRKEVMESLLKRMPNERTEDDPEWVGYNCCLIEIEDLIKSKLK